MTYYVGRNAEATADAVWHAFANTFANAGRATKYVARWDDVNSWGQVV